MNTLGRTTGRCLSLALLSFACFIVLEGIIPGVGVSSARASLLEGPTLLAADSGKLRSSLERGAYDQLETLARNHDDTASLLARGLNAELEGDLEEAKRFADAALGQANKPVESRAARLAKARLQRASGNWKKAENILSDGLSEDDDAHHLRVELGELLVESGRFEEAEPLLDRLSQAYNSGRLNSASGLYALGEAMALLGSSKDANQAYREAYRKDPKFLPGVVRWGHLLLSKYNTSAAKKTFQDALSVNNKHPGALAGLAEVIMEAKNYYEPARRVLRRAEKYYADHPRVLLARATLAIHDKDWKKSVEITDGILEKRPKHLEALAVRAAAQYLGGDTSAFEKTKSRVLKLNDGYADVYNRTAKYAVRNHEYRDAVELYRNALKLDKNSAEAQLGLGMGLSRMGKMDKARKHLKAAYREDGYNVRALNMVRFFDNTLPKYDVFNHGDFLLRAHQSHSDVVNRLASPLVADALETYTEKYGFEPRDELSVEVFRKPETFGVRTVGLPNISPHGICFGRVVATRSPRKGDFNWRQVMWHEMAHVYHIQESDYGVPRWFTEGLAEYETHVKNKSWIRHHERRIAAALRAGEIPSIAKLDREFTRARSYKDILVAYNLSSMALHFIVETWSFEKVNGMVEAFGKSLDTPSVLEKVLETDVATFDKKFRSWLEDRLSNFNRQLLISLKDVDPPRKLRAETSPAVRDGWYHARLAFGRLRQRRKKKATKSMQKALELGENSAKVQYAATAFYANLGRSKKAYEHGLEVFNQGRDDYVHRVRMGRLARVLENIEAAQVHLIAANQLYPNGFAAWRELLKVAESKDNETLERRALRNMFRLKQTSALAARRYTKLHVEAERWQRALDGVERWYAIEPFSSKLHRTRAEVARHVGRPKLALDSWQLLSNLRPAIQKDVWLDAVENLSAFDNASKQLQTAESRAKKAGASKEAIEEARVN